MFEDFLNHLESLIKNLTVLKLTTLATDQLETAKAYLIHINSEKAHSLEIKKQSHKQLAQLKQLSINQEHREQFFSLTRELLQFSQVSHAKKWRNNMAQQFSQPATWDEYHTQLSQHSPEFDQVHNSWQKHSRYALFSTPDLVRTYWQQLLPFAQWLTNVQKEFLTKKNFLSKKSFRHYQKKFQILTNYINTEKTIIRQALMARLELGINHGDLQFDDVIVATTQKLKQLGLLSAVKLPIGICRHLTPKIFTYIQQIITIDGHANEKNKLSSILYTKHPATFVIRKNPLGITFAIPKTAEKFISAKPPFYTKLPKWLHILFRSTKINYKFFQNGTCQYLIIAQQTFDNLTIESNINIHNLRHAASWEYLKYLTTLLATETARLKAISKNLSKTFHTDTHQLLVDHYKFLSIFAQKIFSKQAFIFEKLIWQFENQSKIRSLTEGEKLRLEDIKMSLTLSRKSWQSQWNEADNLKWNLLVNRYQKLLNLPPIIPPIQTYTQATCTLNHKIAQNALLPSIKNELAKNPLVMPSNELTTHLANIQKLFESIPTLQPMLMHSIELQTILYNYVKNLLLTIKSLPNQNVFVSHEDNLNLILQSFTKFNIDKVLQHELLQLTKNIKQFKAFKWDLFLTLTIEPPFNALEQTLQATQLNNLTIDSTDQNTSITKTLKL